MAYDKVVDSAVLDEGLKQIADAIREKAGTTDALAFPQAMADAIAAIQGGGATIEPLTITENGTYTAPDGVDGYSPVTVDVKGSGEELVITNCSYLHYYGARLELLEKWKISNCTDFSSMLYRCESLASVPEFDTSKGTNFENMFFYCKSLQAIPELDLSNSINCNSMFKQCSKLKTLPTLSAPKCGEFNHTFENCYSLESIQGLDIPNVDRAEKMFYNCPALVNLPELNTATCRVFKQMFTYNSNLTSIPRLDVGNAVDVQGMFSNCSKLTNLYLYNIRKSIQIGSGTSWGHLLTVDSLVHTIKELCTVTSSQTLTIGSANLEKIAGLYCRITDDTNEKKPMELCESTDEGAMTLVDYAMEKNWAIQ